MKKTVLLTGASGFIGSRILRELLADRSGMYEVTAISSKPIPGCTTIVHEDHRVTGSAFRKNGSSGVDHLLLVGSFIPHTAQELNDARNTKAIADLEDLLSKLDIPVGNVVFISTVDVYAPVEGRINEQSLIGPSNLYGHAKYYGEGLVTAWAKARNINLCILRLGHVYGPGEGKFNKLIPNAIRTVLRGEAPAIYNGGDEYRSYLFIDDAVRAILSAMEHVGELPACINVVSGEAHPVREIVKTIIRVHGTALEPEKRQAPGTARDLRFDDTLMRQHLCAPEVTLEEGLRLEMGSFLAGHEG